MINRSLLFRFIVILAVAAMPFAAFAGTIGRPSAGGSVIEWQLDLRGQAAVELTVIAPSGQDYTSIAKGGQNPSFRLSQLGQDLEDGQYNYELRAVPNVPSDVARKLEAARKAGDDAAARRIMKTAGLEPITQSGTFTVRNGSIVDPNAIEADANDNASISTHNLGVTTNARPSTPVVNDQVIPDDLIVQGSICVGFDCVNGESFGFDTIRLKENNTRIAFDDTSSTAGFPANDWQIVANDSASGGQSQLSILDQTNSKVPFLVEANAPTSSIYVDSTGRVGFRTSTPVLDLHVKTSNTPALRLEQDSSGGFTAQTWDIAGNEANFFVRDVTGGSRLPFRIRPGAPTSSIDISASGDVGIGTASPQVRMDIRGSSATADLFGALGIDPINGPSFNFGYSGSTFGRGSGFFNVRPDASATAPNPSIRFMTANVARLLIDNEGFLGLGDTASTGANPTSPIQYTNGAVTARLTTAGVWQDNSSRAAKEHIIDLDADVAFKALEDLKPVTYNYKVLPDDPKVGFIAEDVPDLVATPERDGLSALDIVAVLTKVVQEQQKTIDSLNDRLNRIESPNQQ